MGHHITALAIAAPYDKAIAESYDLFERLAWQHVTLFPIDHYWSEHWQAERGGIDGSLYIPLGSHLLPSEGVCRVIAGEITALPAPRFAVINSEYFGGSGDQVAIAYEGERLLTEGNVNAALRALGVVRAPNLDEWDTIGLADYRSNPDYLDKYRGI